MAGIQKVLFLAAESKKVKPASEYRAIKDVVSDKLKIENIPIGSLDSIIAGIQRDGAQIIHFCGDGKSDGNLIIELEGEDNGHEIKPDKLAGAFEGFKEDISCVVLNYCYSAEAAELVSQHIDYVTGIKGLIDREAAIAFSQAFYGALKDDKTLDFDGFQKAVRAGQSALSLQPDTQENILIYYTPKAPEIKLVEPADNSTVPMKTTFKGTYKNLPTDSTMWVYVYPLEDDKYYLTRIDNHKDGEWTQENVILGREGEIDHGKKFKVGVLITDKEVTSTKNLNNEHFHSVELPSGVQGNEYEIVRE